MEFVVARPQARLSPRSRRRRARIMLHIHRSGIGIAGVFTYEVAETKASDVHELAREKGYPLRATVEEANVSPHGRASPERRRPRGRFAAARASRPRAPAVRGGRRGLGGEDPARRRGRRRAAARGAGPLPGRLRRGHAARLQAGARADARLPARAADGRAPRAERGQDRGRRGRHPGRSLGPAALLRGRPPDRARGHPPRHPELHLARDQPPPGRGDGGGRTGRGGRRGGRTGHRPRSAGRLHGEPHRARAAGKARPPDRARRGAAARPGDPLPPAQEQPGVGGRPRGGEDGARGGAGHAPDPARRAGGAEGCRGLRPRRRRAPCRDALPRGFRGASEGRDRRAEEAAEADPVHRRDAHHGRRGS